MLVLLSLEGVLPSDFDRLKALRGDRFAARAQQAGKLPTIGFLGATID
jgi:hypothetical protein